MISEQAALIEDLQAGSGLKRSLMSRYEDEPYIFDVLSRLDAAQVETVKLTQATEKRLMKSKKKPNTPILAMSPEFRSPIPFDTPHNRDTIDSIYGLEGSVKKYEPRVTDSITDFEPSLSYSR